MTEPATERVQGFLDRTRTLLKRYGADATAFFLPALIYLFTLCPTVYTMDSAELTLGARYLGLIHAPGHPLYLLVGWVFTQLPIGDVAYRVNLMSALFAGCTILLLYRLGRALKLRPLFALSAALLFGFSRSFWAVANVAEVYTLHTTLVLGLLLLFLRWRENQNDLLLGWIAFGWGLSHGSHTSSILLAPAFLYGTRPAWPRLLKARRILLLALLFFLGLAVFVYLPLRYAASPAVNYISQYFEPKPTTLSGLWWMVSGSMFTPEFFAYSFEHILGEIGFFLNLLWSDFVGLGVLLGAWGLWTGLQKRREEAIFLLLIFFLPTIFFLNYGVVDKQSMFLIPEMIWAMWAGWGIEALSNLERRSTPDRSQGDPTRVAAPQGRSWARFGVLGLPLLSLALNYAAVDESATWIVRDFSRQTLTQVRRNAVVLAEWSSASPMEYVQMVEQHRPDVEVVNISFFLLGQRDRLRRRLPPDRADDALDDALLGLVESRIRDHTVYTFGWDPVLASKYEFWPAGRRIYTLVPRGARDYKGTKRCRWLLCRP
jgi:hypothetical protein